MFQFIFAVLAIVRVFFRSRHETALEILALRQQVAVLKRKRPRPRLNPGDRLFSITLRQVWSRWAKVLVVVKPETVVGWHGEISALLEKAVASPSSNLESQRRWLQIDYLLHVLRNSLGAFGGPGSVVLSIQGIALR